MLDYNVGSSGYFYCYLWIFGLNLKLKLLRESNNIVYFDVFIVLIDFVKVFINMWYNKVLF